MKSFTRERLAEIAAAAAVIAVLATAICLGDLFLEHREFSRLSALLLPMAETNLQARSGTNLVQKNLGVRPTGLIRRAFRYEDKKGTLLGAGLSVRMALPAWDAELLVVTDESGRIRAYEARGGAPGVCAEELETYVRSRRKGTGGGLDVAVDIKSLDFSVASALEEASRFVRSWGGGPK